MTPYDIFDSEILLFMGVLKCTLQDFYLALRRVPIHCTDTQR